MSSGVDDDRCVPYVDAMRRTSIAGLSRAILVIPFLLVALGAAALDRSDNLPFFDEIIRDRLPNGMEYFVLEHPFPEDRVVLRLIVDAGSVLETEAQRGLAHFVEHMAFNGTEEYGETELVAYLESLGIQFGPDVNAYTSFDETVYKLEIPADNPEALATGFRVMQQWASALTFESDAIERERGVIVEEWRGSRGPTQRMLEEHIPVLFAGSRYAERLPIGEMDVVRSAGRDEFLRFYDRWYRPDNMAFVAVGDLPARQLERLVRQSMGPIERPEDPLDRPYFFVPDQPGVRVSIAGDTEASRSTVSVYSFGSPPPAQRIGDYRDMLVRALFVSILNERVRDIARDAAAPITSGGFGFNRFLRDTEITVSSAVVRGSEVLDAFETLVTEVERAGRCGVTDGEVDRARRRMMQSIEDSFVNYETRPSVSLADELVRHWIHGESVPGISFESELYREFLPGITTEEVAAVADSFDLVDNAVILANIRLGEEGQLPDGRPVPEEAEFLSILDRVRGSQLAPPVEEEGAASILPEPPEPGSIVGRIDHDAVATTELLLSNGARVYLKPTTLSEDEVLLSGYSPGGLSLVPDRLTAAARLAPSVARESGLGDLDAPQLDRLMAGRSARLGLDIGRTSEGLSGSSRAEDVPLLLEMVHAAFAAPRLDSGALENVRRQTIQQLEGAAASPRGRFSDRLQELFAAGDPRLQAPAPEGVAAVTLDDVATVYSDRFADPADFAFFIVGSFDPEEMETQIERFLASIPRPAPATSEPATSGPADASHFLESPADVGYPRPDGIVAEILNAGTEPVGQLVMVLHSPYEWSQRENVRFNALGSFLDTRMREEIRESAGGAYSVGAGGWRWRYPQPWAYMQVGFGFDPHRLEELRRRTLAVIDEVRSEAPSPDYLERIRAQQRQEYQRSLQENSYWLAVLEFSVENGRPFEQILDFPRLLEELDAEDIRSTAQRYLDPDRRIELVLVPADSAE
jgi:zinc protease